MSSLEGKVAVVTGASRGIGRAIAEDLASNGAVVVINYNASADAANEVVEAIKANGGEALAVQADVSSFDAAETLIKTAIDTYGHVDILVNNAGAIRSGSLLSKPDEDWLTDWSLKVFGYIRLSREVYPIMQEKGSGRIINIIGTAGRQPNAAYLAGGGANAALMNMTKALADEGAPHNILVNAINPGPIRTERWGSLMSQLSVAQGRTPQEVEAAWLHGNPLQRPGEPHEVAGLVVFLASQRASYINGVIVPIDGGAIRCI